MATPFIIAIDGHSSCGKSTLAKALAEKLGFTYIDSGAMYRAVTLYFLRNNIDLADNGAVAEALDSIFIVLEPRAGRLAVLLNGEDVSEDIRQMPVSALVSKVSAIPAVRRKLVGLQQKMGQQENIVMDGRDIGTVVFPGASLKIFMTADPEIRARRRFRELRAKGLDVSLDEVLENLLERDREDSSRSEGPLARAPGAIVLDNSHMSREEQLNWIMEKIKEKL
ncbi:MAG TPA: (d)CMP kinase [Anseongella sp.]|nr:(d)CMP kinase [Anseongella sp.]